MNCKCKQIIELGQKGMKAIGPYSLGVATCQQVFTSGQIGLSAESNEMVPGGIEAETRQAIENLSLILSAAGTDLGKVIKTTVYLNDIKDFVAMNAAYAEYFPLDPPARTTIQVVALPKNALVEIEAIAIKPCDECYQSSEGCDCGCDSK
jgi:2-iminobutanoate/2-iminopropanoate deaminase